MSATSVSAVENYIRAEKPSPFSETAREILLDQGEKGGGGRIERQEERQRERKAGTGKTKEDREKNRTVERPSRQVVGTGPRRGETGEQSHYQGNPA